MSIWVPITTLVSSATHWIFTYNIRLFVIVVSLDLFICCGIVLELIIRIKLLLLVELVFILIILLLRVLINSKIICVEKVVLDHRWRSRHARNTLDVLVNHRHLRNALEIWHLHLWNTHDWKLCILVYLLWIHIVILHIFTWISNVHSNSTWLICQSLYFLCMMRIHLYILIYRFILHLLIFIHKRLLVWLVVSLHIILQQLLL